MKKDDNDNSQLNIELELGERYFSRGKKKFANDQFVEAFAIWKEGFSRCPEAFVANQEVTNQMRELVSQYKQENKFDELSRTYLKKTKNDEATENDTYQLFSMLFFSLGLMPEVFEDQEKLHEQLEYWQKQLEAEGIFPYVHFRTGVLMCYLGEIEQAQEELRFCRDHAPSTKTRSLKVEQILSYLREILRNSITEVSQDVSTASEQDWSANGFEDKFSVEAWKKTGLDPEAAAEWRDEGFSASQASSWHQLEISLAEATAWRAAGFSSGKNAKKWLRAGINAADAASWLAQFSDDIEQAIRFQQAGFSDPREAKKWLEVFSMPFDAAGWYQLGFSPEEAADWRREGIRDPYEAKKQKEADEAAFAAAAAENTEES